MTERVLVIGLDGGTWSVLAPYMEAGLLPTLSGLANRAYRGILRSTLPPITPVAWTSMATGVNPGKHRIFGFGSLHNANGEYVAPVTHRRDVAKPSLWRILSDHGRCSRIVHVPMTYPPEQIEGSIVSGMFTPGPEFPYTWPPALKDELTAAGIEPKFTTDLAGRARAFPELALSQAIAGDASPFLDDVDDMTRRQHQVACHLIRKEWHLFMKVYQGTDIIQHVLWDDLQPPTPQQPGSPRPRRIAQSLRLIDDCVGELIRLAGTGATVIVVSDHGFGRHCGRVALGRWLSQRGYAAFRPASVTGVARHLARKLGLRTLIRRMLGQSLANRVSSGTLPMRWDRTQAFVDDSATGMALRINTRGRFRQGIVEPGAAYERLRDELVEVLQGLRIDGLDGPPIPQVLKREDVYTGPYVEDAPDLLLLPNPDALVTFANGRPKDPLFRALPEKPGNHLLDGICMVAGSGVRAGPQMCEADITDVAPTVLALLGLPIPDYMDGRVLSEAFIDPPTVTIQAVPHEPDRAEAAQAFSADEQAQIEQRLRNLGYLE